MAESNPASRRRSVLSVDLHPRRRSSEAPEVAEASLASQRRSGLSMDPRSGRSRLTNVPADGGDVYGVPPMGVAKFHPPIKEEIEPSSPEGIESDESHGPSASCSVRVGD